MRAVVLLGALLALSGCAGSSIPDIVAALANDKASVCVTVHNAYPPFANDFTIARAGEGGSAVSGNPCSLIQGGAATPAVSATTVLAAPVTTK